MKEMLGQSDLVWNVDKKQGAYMVKPKTCRIRPVDPRHTRYTRNDRRTTSSNSQSRRIYPKKLTIKKVIQMMPECSQLMTINTNRKEFNQLKIFSKTRGCSQQTINTNRCRSKKKTNRTRNKNMSRSRTLAMKNHR